MRNFPQQPRPVPAQIELPQKFPELPKEIVDRYGDAARDWQRRLDEFWTRSNQAMQQAQVQTAAQVNSNVVFNVDSFLIYANGVPTAMFALDSTGVRLGNVLVVNTPGRTVFIGAGEYANANTPFYIDTAGNFSLGDSLVWDAATDSLTITGSIIATSGTIGGFDIGADYIRDTANSMGMASTVTGGDDVRFWAGNTFANRGIAPFNVTESGILTATNNAVIVGTVSGRLTATLAAAINASGNLITDVVNPRLDSASKFILSDFNFGTTDYAGAVKSGTITWNTATGAITGGSGVIVYRSGIVGANAGVTTFAINAVTGAATFAGTLSAPSGTIGGWTINPTTLVGGNATLDSVGQLILGTVNDVVVLSAADATYRIWIGNATAGSAAFNVTKAGVLTATGATITGSITATSGSIGGFTISASTLLANSGTGDRFFIDSSPGNITISMGDNSLGVGQINMIGGVTNSNIAVYAATGSGAGGVQLAINDTSTSGIVRITNNSGLGIVLASFLNQITFDGDTNIYRSAANTLKTDDAFICVGTLTAGSFTNNLSSFASTTSAQLAGIISDETGTGVLVFSASPTFTGTVTMAALTATSLIDISGASAGQIQFPATQNPSANANTLDDYEEGTFTPSLGGSATYTLQSGTYTKVGRNVHFQLRLTVNAIGTGSTTVISGLPFTSAATIYGTCAIGYFASLATNVIALYGYVNPSATTIGFSMMNASGASVTNTPAIFGSGTDIILTGYYSV